MSNFAVSYRQNFWIFFFVHLLGAGAYIFLEGTQLAPVLELLVLVLIIIFSVIHFVGLLAVFMDTHRKASINSIYLKQILELLKKQDLDQATSENVLEEDLNTSDDFTAPRE